MITGTMRLFLLTSPTGKASTMPSLLDRENRAPRALLLLSAISISVLVPRESTACQPCQVPPTTGIYGYTFVWEYIPCGPNTSESTYIWNLRAFSCETHEQVLCCPPTELISQQIGYADGSGLGAECGAIPPLSFSLCEDKDAPKECRPDGGAPGNSPIQQVGDPVDLATGFMEQTLTDLDIGGGLEMTRHYVSDHNSTHRRIGKGWRFSLDWRMRREVVGATGGQLRNESVVIERPLAGGVSFIRYPEGSTGPWSGPPQAAGSLAGDFSGELTYTDPNGVAVTFDSSDQLVEIKEPGSPPVSVSHTPTETVFSNAAGSLTLEWDASDRVAAAIANEGTADEIEVTYTYVGNDLLDTVTHPDHSSSTPSAVVVWDYSYGGSNRLTKVERTAGGTTATIAEWQFSNGRVVRVDEPALPQPLRFSYSSAGGIDQTTIMDDASTPVAVMESQDGRMTSLTGSAPGIELPYAAAETELFRWKRTTDHNGNITLYGDYDDQNRYQLKVEGWIDGGASGTPDGEFSPDDDYARITEYTWHPWLHEPLSVRRESTLTGVLGDAEAIYDYDDLDDPADDFYTPNENPTGRLSARIERGKTLDSSGAIVDVEAMTAFAYDAEGRVKIETGPRLLINFTEYDYDPGSGHRTKMTEWIDGSTNLETTYANFDAHGNPQTLTDPNGRVTTYTYDSAGRIKTVTPPYSGAGDPTMTFHYDADGQVVQVDFPPDTSGDPYYLVLDYDAKKNLRFAKEAVGGPSAAGDAIVYEYDRGNISRVSFHRGFVDLAASGTRVGDVRAEYDVVDGRIQKILNPLFGDDSVFSAFSHDPNGNITSMIHESGTQDIALFDALDRVVEVQQVRSSTHTTEVAYDARSNVARIEDPEGKGTDYVFDDLGRLVEITAPDTGTTRFVYDPAGNLVQRIEAAGTAAERSTHYAYDGLDRVTLIDYPTDADWVFEYDLNAADNQKSRLARVSNGSVTSDYSYTDDGSIAVQGLELAVKGRRYETSYTYDAAGNVSTVIPPSGVVLSYAYEGSRVSGIDITAGSHQTSATGFKWLPFGPLEEVDLPPENGSGQNQLAVTRNYNLRYQLEEMDSVGPFGAVVDRSYTYDYTAGAPGPVDPGPNIDRMVDHLVPGESRFYFYDELDRLQKVTDLSGSTVFDYAYDAAGNRTTKTAPGGTTSYSYESGTNRLDGSTGAEAKDYAHDAFGNRIWAGSTPYAGQAMYLYSESNRLTEIRRESGTTISEYAYDAFGRLVYEDGRVLIWGQDDTLLMGLILPDDPSGATGTYIRAEGELLGRVDWLLLTIGTPLAEGPLGWVPELPDVEPWGLVVAVAALAGGLVMLFALPRRRRVLVPAAAGVLGVGIVVGCPVDQTPSFLWFHTDPVGTPLLMTRGTDGAVVVEAEYTPFGEATVDHDPDGDEFPEQMMTRSPGQLEDGTAGLHYNFFRTYDPKTGRYLEADPIGQAGGLNVYAYAGNNPVNDFDELGLDPQGRGLRDVVNDLAKRSIDVLTDWAVDRMLRPEGKQAVCQVRLKECQLECQDEAVVDAARYARALQECDDEFRECLDKPANELLKEKMGTIEEPMGVTPPDIGHGDTPNVIDNFARGRGKKVD